MVSGAGYLTFNLLAYDKETLDKAYSLIKEVDAKTKYVIEGEEEVNKVIFLTK